MPEGDTLFKLAAYLALHLEGRQILRGFAGKPGVDLAAESIATVRANGKHLFLELRDGRVVRSHLGMWGSWHQYPSGASWQKPAQQAGIVLDLGEEIFVCFNPREVEVLRTNGVRARVLTARLGPDLLGARLELKQVVSRARELADPNTIIADVLLDQRIAGGIGNVYKSEALFLAGLPPETPLAEVTDGDLEQLYGTARRLLLENRGPGPRTTASASGTRTRLWVYRRRGLPCLRCGVPVLYARLGRHHRSTYWCPHCQLAPHILWNGMSRDQ